MILKIKVNTFTYIEIIVSISIIMIFITTSFLFFNKSSTIFNKVNKDLTLNILSDNTINLYKKNYFKQDNFFYNLTDAKYIFNKDKNVGNYAKINIKKIIIKNKTNFILRLKYKKNEKNFYFTK